MSLKSSWHWLAPRLTIRDLLSTPNQTGDSQRPCLAEVESLGDRLLMSASVEVPAPAPETIVTTLLKASIGTTGATDSILANGLALYKAAGSLEGVNAVKLNQFSHKLTDSLLKIDTIFFKFADDLIKGEVTGIKYNKALGAYNDELLKLDKLISDFGGTGENNPLYAQKIKLEKTAGDLWESYKLFGAGAKVDSKVELVFHKLTDDFLDVEGGLLKLGDDTIAKTNKGSNKGDIEYLKIKLEDVLISSYKVSDSDLKAELLGYINAATEMENSLIGAPGNGGGEGGGVIGGVIVLLADVDDVIT